MLVGKTLDKRYTILECIGGGGMADVYRAQDTLLDRPVAVKVLRSQFAGDDQFVRRFRHEAQAAARVSHPHIVNIYDVGKDEDVYYIVMEYIQGETLKEYIERKNKLSMEEAVSIALQICEALDHAHQNNLIHCDIKPHNILLGKGGRVKVTDFGIARAVTSATMTQTGTIIGSVHYISPEQAKGGVASVHSDIYSLGIVLYEMMTGQVPFSGESPISIALKHLQEEIIPPTQLNPGVPPMLEAIVLKSVAKEPEKRYPAITSMMHDLEVVQSTLRDGDTRRLAKGDFPTQVLPRVEQPEKFPVQEPQAKKSRKSFWTIMLLLLLAGFAIGMFMAFGRFWSLEDVIVPDVSGQSVSEAQEKLLAAGLKVNIAGYGYSTKVPPNHVLSQSPEAGSAVKQSRTINLTISKGTEAIVVPDIRGMPLRDAEVQLKNYGLALGKVDEQYTNDAPQGVVINQNPRPPTQVNKGTSVDVTVSKGTAPRKFVLPDFRGSTLVSVRTQLDSLKLKLGNVLEAPNDQFPAGVITGQNPEPGSQVEEGNTINFTISKGAGAGGLLKKAAVQVTVPEGPKRQSIQIVVTDSNGRRTVYDNTHKPGDRIEQTVEGTGTMRIQVYINGTLIQEQTV